MNQKQTAALSRRLASIFAISFVLPVAWVLSHLVFPQRVPMPSLGWIFALWLGSLICTAQLEHRRHNRERVQMPAA